MFHRSLLSVTLAPQNAALSARNVGTDTADRTVSTHHHNAQIATPLIKSQNLKLHFLEVTVHAMDLWGLVTAVVAAVREGIYFGFYKTEGPAKLAYGVES